MGSSHERLEYWNERGYRNKPKTYPSVEPIIRFMNLILLIAK